MRWLMPMPVFPAMTAGTQPPEGVTETTQPSASAASTEVVPAWKASSNVRGERVFAPSVPAAPAFFGGGGHLARRSAYGFVERWNGYGSPGLTFGSFFAQSIVLARTCAYSFERRPRTGGAGWYEGSP